MVSGDVADGADRADDNAGVVDAELRDAKIECTNDIFGRVLNQLDEEQQKLKLMVKFPDVYQQHQGQIEELTHKFQTDMKHKRKTQKNV